MEAIQVELDTPARAELLEPPTAVPGVEGFRRLRSAALAAAGVLAVGLGVNFARVVRDPRVTGVACVESQLGLPVVGSLPRIPRLAGGDGASLELHTRLGQDGSVGLAEVLRDEVTVGQALADTEVPGLSLLAAGRWDPDSTRALGSGRWKAVLAEASAAYEYVVIDSPPLLPVADGLAMARDVDGVLLSVLSDVSHLPSVAEAQKRLAAVRANVLGVVLSGAAQVLYRYPPSDPVVQLAALPAQADEYQETA